MARIKGVAVTLHERQQTGPDTYETVPVTVENVLICPATQNDIVDDEGLLGRRAEYELLIPKGDAHRWDNSQVDFFGRQFRVFGAPLEYIEAMTPLSWNRRVKVERIE